jgi:hypothetical protein
MSLVIGASRGWFRWLLAVFVSAMLPLMPPSSTKLVAAALPSGATLTILADPVQVSSTSADGLTFADAVAGQSLAAGDIVRTGSSGIALLTFFDGSESQLGADSQLQIEQADYDPAPQIALLQTGGVSVNRVIPLPPGGSFRTDTPDATGLVRGTSYVVSVGTDDSAPGTSMVLLTDRDGHVGHVQLVPSAPAITDDTPVATVDLVQAGDVGAAFGLATATAHLEAAALARLEAGARDLRDVEGAHQAHEVAKQLLQATSPALRSAWRVEPTPSVAPSESLTSVAHVNSLSMATPTPARPPVATTKPEPVRASPSPKPTSAPAATSIAQPPTRT